MSAEWMESARKWVITIFAILSAVALYLFVSKKFLGDKVNELDKRIDEIKARIAGKEKRRQELEKDAAAAAVHGETLDKEIEKAKKKQKNLQVKRDKMKEIFDKYGDKL